MPPAFFWSNPGQTIRPLISKRFDRIQIRRFNCWIRAENHSHHRADRQAEYTPVQRQFGRNLQKKGRGIPGPDSKNHANHPAHFAKHDRLQHELA
jgi:hypothetical protein